jgi:replicative DNA helicase
MKNGTPTTDRLPPHSIEAERGVLGCILLEPGLAIPECAAIGPDSMYDLRHRAIFTNLMAMHDERIPIDMLTIHERLRASGQLEAAGGLGYIAALPEAVPSAAHVSYYVKLVGEKARLRKIIQVSTQIASAAYEAAEEDVEDVIDEAEQAILKLGDQTTVKVLPTMMELAHRAIATIEDFHARQGIITGLSTGFPDLDKITFGLQPSEMIVIAARPSMGKTALAVQIAEHVAVEQKLPVGIFSLEMTADSLMLRMLCSRARVNIRNMREGFMAERDFPKLSGAAGKLSKAPMYIDDASGLSVFQLRTKARRMAAQFEIKLFVIDYLQLLHSSNRKADNRQQEIADISGGLKALAKELKVPVIVLSQLNRDVERDGKRRPRLSDLRESGAIEQDADLVGLLYKPQSDDDEDVDNAEIGAVNLLIAKQRNGPAQVDVHLTFLRGYTRFESAAKVSADDLPDQPNLPHND